MPGREKHRQHPQATALAKYECGCVRRLPGNLATGRQALANDKTKTFIFRILVSLTAGSRWGSTSFSRSCPALAPGLWLKEERAPRLAGMLLFTTGSALCGQP